MKQLLPTLLCLGLAVAFASAQNSFYAQPPLFSYSPDETKSLTTIKHLGAVGMGIDLIQPAFRMQIHLIEEGSPAAATGKLKAGQMIESINGQTLKDIDPRIQLGQIIEKAEATDGIVKFAIEGEAEPVIVKIPVLGAYSKTWPLDCPKSDKIVRGFADYLTKPGSDKGFADIGMLFLLSTGEDKDLAPVKEWVSRASKHRTATPGTSATAASPLCEYYLRTGDTEAFDKSRLGWIKSPPKANTSTPGRPRSGSPSSPTATATSTPAAPPWSPSCCSPSNAARRSMTGLLTALSPFLPLSPVAASIPTATSGPEDLASSTTARTATLAFAMAAAASLTPDGEKSIYAKARDVWR